MGFLGMKIFTNKGWFQVAGRCLTMDLSAVKIPYMYHIYVEICRAKIANHVRGMKTGDHGQNELKLQTRFKPLGMLNRHFPNLLKGTPFFCWNKPQQKRHKCSGGPGCHRCHQQVTSPTLQLKPVSPLIRFGWTSIIQFHGFFWTAPKIITSVFCH